MRRARTTALAALVASIALAPWPVVAQDRGREILDEAELRYDGVASLCADFVQRLQVPLLGSERTGSGRVCQARPNLFAMRFTDPEGDVVVNDGSSVWVYLPSNDARQVLRTPADRTAGGLDYHREFLVDAESRYDIEYVADEQVAGAHTHRLRLVPKGRAGYREVSVWIDRGEPILRQIRIEEVNGNVRTITLADVQFDATPGSGWFAFTPPDGAVVVSGGPR